MPPVLQPWLSAPVSSKLLALAGVFFCGFSFSFSAAWAASMASSLSSAVIRLSLDAALLRSIAAMHEDHRVRTAGLGLKTHGVKTADAQRSLFLEPKVCDAVLAWFDGTSCALHDFCATVFDDTHFELDRWTHARARARAH